MMNILRLLLLMPTLALASDTSSGLNSTGEEADIASGLPNCTQYKIDFNTDNCICNSGSTCSDKKSYYETNCINNC